MRFVTTSSSLWMFDMANMLYSRVPIDANRVGNIPYSGEWEPFEELEESPNNTIVVHRPVPWGRGARRETGYILHDTGDTRHA